METKDLIITAIRKQYRYKTSGGMVTTEDLFTLPLAKGRYNLNTIAKGIYEELQTEGEVDFVGTSTAATKELSNKLEIVKYVIATKKEEALAAKERAEKKAKKDRILEIMANKKEQALEALSLEELEKMAEEL